MFNKIPNLDILILVAAVVVMLLVIGWVTTWVLGHRKQKRLDVLQTENIWLQRLMGCHQPNRGIDRNLDDILRVISDWVDAPTYAFYTIDSRERNYVLRAIRHLSEAQANIEPSYSGLMPYQMESYLPPLSLPLEAAQGEVRIVEEGEIPLLNVPIGVQGIIRIGPYKITKKTDRKVLEVFSRSTIAIREILYNMLETEQMRSQIGVVVASGRALQTVSQIAGNSQIMLEVLLQTCMSACGAQGVILIRRTNGKLEIPVQNNMSEQAVQSLLSEFQFVHELDTITEIGKSPYVIERGQDKYYELPLALGALDARALAVARVSSDLWMLLWFADAEDEPHQEIGQSVLTAIEMTAQGLGEVLVSQIPLAPLTRVYTNILKQLSQLVDNMNPYTVGYSELMARYSVAIAQELRLPPSEIRDIALAAQLSNIGVLGLSCDLLHKEGAYTDIEYDLMKLHAEVGASIVRITTGNERAASYVMHHHERIDGNGYPAGLGGEDIPVGARILAVVQVFLAKINGRKHRDPVEFADAFERLRAASGTHLDEQVVEALIAWFERKRTNEVHSGRALGQCWEMLAVPAEVCAKCPVLQQSERNCWEVHANLCAAHGKSCETCFVYTEFQSRTQTKKLA